MLFVGTSIIHPSTEGVFLLCNILDLLIYSRNLDILVEEGALRKVEVPDGPNRFDFTLKNHYHVRCIKCGEIFDVDMDQIPDLLERIHNTHGIEFVDYDISFKGICPKCREKVKEEQHG